MRWHFPSLSIVLLSLNLSVYADDEKPCDPNFFNRAHLESLVQNKKIETLAQLLALAPNCFKTNQVAIYKSHSLHCANYKAPRILIYMNDDATGSTAGNTVCSFNSGNKEDYQEFYVNTPDRDCHEDAMECQHFNTEKSRFEYFQVSFPKDDQGKAFKPTLSKASRVNVSEVNPTTCLTCHRGNTSFLGEANPRPNLENYPVWPGFYGSLHDKFDATPSEKEHYNKDFLSYRQANQRYAALPLILDENMHYSGSNSKPAVNLQNLLESQNQKRIASEFTDPRLTDQAWPFRYAILASLACNDERRGYTSDGKEVPAQWKFGIETFLPEKLRAKFQTSYAKFASEALRLHKKNIQSLYDTQALAGKSFLDQFDDQYHADIKVDPNQSYASYELSGDTASEFWPVTRLAYLGFNLGLPVWDWSMTFQSTVDFEAGRHNFQQIFPLLASKFYNSETDKDLDLSQAAGFGGAVDEKFCQKLRDKSLAALAAISDGGQDFRMIRTQGKAGMIADLPEGISSSSVKVHTPPPNINLCMKCHVSGDAIPIPFDQPEKLRNALYAPASTHSSNLLIDEIIQRLDSGSMPKNKVISTGERNDLKDYFLSILTE